MSKVTRKVMIGAITVGSVVVFSSLCFGGMTAQKVINHMKQAYEKQMKGIKDVTITQKNTGGMADLVGETKTYQKRAKVKRRVIYKTRTEMEMMGKVVVTIYDGEYSWSVNPISGKVEKKEAEHDSTQMWRNLDPSETHYLGIEKIDGEKTYVLKIDDASKVFGTQMSPPSGKDEESKKGKVLTEGKLWIHTKTGLPIRTLTIMNIKSIEEGKEVTMTYKITTDYKDYKEFKGMFVSHKMVMSTTVEVKTDMSGLSKEEKKRKEEAMKMMKQFMEKMASFVIETTDVKVNTGLSDDLFDGTKLKTGKPMKLFK